MNLDAISADAHPRSSLRKAVALVGLMGAGKTAVGRRLAKTLKAPFADADDEIEVAAGLTIAEIFELYGEAKFRDLERRVVARLIAGPPLILALGGGAFIDPATRELLKAQALTVWLKADVETLLERTNKRRGVRPLLMQDDPVQVLNRLMKERHPLYAEADHMLESSQNRLEDMVRSICLIIETEGLM